MPTLQLELWQLAEQRRDVLVHVEEKGDGQRNERAEAERVQNIDACIRAPFEGPHEPRPVVDAVGHVVLGVARARGADSGFIADTLQRQPKRRHPACRAEAIAKDFEPLDRLRARPVRDQRDHDDGDGEAVVRKEAEQRHRERLPAPCPAEPERDGAGRDCADGREEGRAEVLRGTDGAAFKVQHRPVDATLHIDRAHKATKDLVGETGHVPDVAAPATCRRDD
mmetsp:Transcript_26600/g.55909  ORF Transcript_26600/g.55909 Transcript_26600/m.55909 type:complete len:224 (+) Transcript_26600:1351-2022(+)|eukprot:476812-Pleurochrysis_carterae.AAC.1